MTVFSAFLKLPFFLFYALPAHAHKTPRRVPRYIATHTQQHLRPSDSLGVQPSIPG